MAEQPKKDDTRWTDDSGWRKVEKKDERKKPVERPR